MAILLQTQLVEAVNSVKRKSAYAEIPPVSFAGELEARSSGNWTPHYNVLLTKGYVQSGTTGTENATFTVAKREFLNPNLVVLKSFTLPSIKRKEVFTFNNAINPN